MENATASAYAWRASTEDVTQTIGLGAALAPFLEPNDVVVLTGDLGAGKTQFAKGVASGLGASGRVTSPTFNIMLSYEDGRLPLYHFDLYRLDDRWELDDIDYRGILEDGGVSLVEWAEKFPDDLPEQYLEVCLRVVYGALPEAGEAQAEVSGATDRIMLVRGKGVRGEELAARWAAGAGLEPVL